MRMVCETCEQQVEITVDDASDGIIPIRVEVRCQGRPLEGPDSAEDHGPMVPA